MLSVLASYKLATARTSAERIEIIHSQFVELESSIEKNPFFAVSQTLQFILKSFCLLCKWADQMMQGDANAEHLLIAAKLQMDAMSLSMEDAQPFSTFIYSVNITEQLIRKITSPKDLDEVALQIAKIPLPFGYLVTNPIWSYRKRYKNYHLNEPTIPKKSIPLVVKVMFELDNRPWNTPQIIQSGTIYSLKATVSIPHWPEGYDRLKIDYVSTLPPNTYNLTPLLIEKSDSSLSEFEINGHAQFPQAQSLASEATDIQVRASFFDSEDKDNHLSTTIIGYHQLRVKAVEKIPSLSGFPAIDERNYEIWEQVRQLSGVSITHAEDFIQALATITNYMNINLQQGLYKEGVKISESEFQKDLLEHMYSRLGADVKEAPRVGGGIKDIEYRSITVELKVEDSIKDRRKVVEKYLSQPTQYTSVSGSQLGIMCILDLTFKSHPIANPKNNVLLETPILHGFEDGNVKFPTKIAVVIIEGNLRLPSTYSR